MNRFVNIKHFKDGLKDIDIMSARVVSVEKDKEMTDKNDNRVNVTGVTVTAGDETIYVNLWGRWRMMSGYLEPGDCINILNAKSRDFSESMTVNVLDGSALGYVVLEPDTLIEATRMALVAIKRNHFCFFKYHLKKIKIENVINYPIIKGNLVGNVFDDFLISGSAFDFDSSFLAALGREKLKFALVDHAPDCNRVKDEVKANIDNLIGWYEGSGLKDHEKLIEPNFISHRYGLSGRMDILFKDDDGSVITELKTGRAPENGAWISHMFQLLCYSFLHDSVYGDGGGGQNTILYSGAKNIARAIQFKNEIKRDLIFIRNKMVFYEKRYRDFDYDALLSFQRDKEDCSNCPSYLKSSCKDIYSTFDGLDDSERGYYFSLFKAVERESEESKKKNRLIRKGAPQEDEDSGGLTKYALDGLRFSRYDRDEETALFSFDENSSEIREGDSIVLYSGDPEHERLYKGRVKKLSPGDIMLHLSNNYTHDFDSEKEWSLNRYDYLLGAKVMLDGLYKFVSGDKRFKDLIMLKRNPEFDSLNIIESKSPGFTLNSAQSRAVSKSICASDYFLVQGPPGTGKTKTIAFIINELIKRKQRVILTALTNRAVDNVLTRLIEDHGYHDFLRIGHEPSVDPEIHKYLLSAKARGYEVDNINGLKDELSKYPLIATTTTSASLSAFLDSVDFDAAIVDEASQIPEPSIFSTITRAKKFILVGDVHQLGPVVRSEYIIPADDEILPAGVTGLGKTLFERLWDYSRNRYDIEEDNDPCIVLDTQYRMNSEIAEFSNTRFYDGVIKNDESVAKGELTLKNSGVLPEALDPKLPIVFIDVPVGDGRNGSPRANEEEAKAVKDIVSMLIDEGIRGSDIGIITPFKAQCALIRRLIEPLNSDRRIVVDTVERFQGSERDVIITSFTVRDQSGLGFLQENDTMNRKLNVTITRARKKLILLGAKSVLKKDPVYAGLMGYIKGLHR